MSDLTPSAIGEDESDGSSPMEDDGRHTEAVGNKGDTAPSSPNGSVSDSEHTGEQSRRRRSTSYVRLRTTTTTTSSATVTAAKGPLLDRISGVQANNRSGNVPKLGAVRAGHRMLLPDAPAVAPIGMTALRQHVEELSAQLKYARTKQESDATMIKELETENARLKNLVDSAGEVSDAAAASLRELARSRRTVDDLRQEADALQRRAQDAELRCEQLQQLLRDTELRLGDAEQRAASARAQHAERASARVEHALEASNERMQNAERRAARAEQIAAQEQARAADACQRASRAETAAAEDHERALDAERRAARAEHLLEQLQEQTLELEQQVAHAEQLAGAEVNRIADAERRAVRAEQAAAQERERALAADRRVARLEEEVEQARAHAVAADRRAALGENTVDEERARADAAERRAARAEQAAEEARKLVVDAERRTTRAAQALDEAERRAVRAEQAHEEVLARAEEAERRAARANQSLQAAEARAHEAERRAGRAEQVQQEAVAGAAESERRALRAEQAQSEAVADLERRLTRAEQAAEDARVHASEVEKRAARAEQASQQDRQSASDSDRQVARMQQALEQAHADVLAAQRRAVRAEQAAEEVRSKADEAKAQAGQAEAKAAHAEQLLVQERGRVQEEARHAARMEAASLQDHERAREAEERAVAALARAQQAETRLAVAEGHTAALETRLQQALTYADAADARAVDAERRYDRLAADSRELHAAVLHLANNPDIAALAAPHKSRAQLPQEKDRSPRRLPWHGATGRPRKTQDNDPAEQAQDLASPRRLTSAESDNSKRAGGEADGNVEAISAASTPGLAAPGSSALVRLWADAYATPSPDPGSTGKDAQKGSGNWRAAPCRISADQMRSSDGGQGPRTVGSPSRLAQATGQDSGPGSSRGFGSLELFIDGTSAMADELRHLRGELRNTRHELNDVRSRYSAACNRVQALEEQAANVDKLEAKMEKLTAQARKCEHLAAELKVCRTQLAGMEGLQIDLCKAQAELAELQDLRAHLEDARAQLVEMDRVRSEARRVNALLQTVTRERDAARCELQEVSAQAVSVASLKAQLQRLETALAEAEQGREEARAANAATLGRQEKLRAQLSAAEEELGEALRRCARLQATAEEASHQRDRLQVALDGAEGALQAAEEERAVLAAAQDRAKGKLQELADVQEEVRLFKFQLQDAVTMQRRAVQAEQQASLRAEESQKQIAVLKTQLAQASAAQAEAAVFKQKLEHALGQVQTMKGDLSAAADRLEGYAQLQADHATTIERAEKAEAQLRGANEAASRTAEQFQQLQQELAEARRGLAKAREDLAAASSLASSRGSRAAELEHEVAILREKSYQLEVEVASMTTELQRLKADLASASDMIEEATSERNQLSQQLSELTKQQARGAAAASAAEERLKADLQQLQVRLATSEAECRSLQHSNGSLHDELERTRGEVLTLQGQLKEEHRHREENASECRRLQRELETTTEAVAQAQRSHRTAVAASAELEQDLERLRSGHNALESELQVANARIQRLQEDTRQLADRNSELSQQLHNMSATVRQLEAENARLADGHATLTVEMEVRAAEARAARGEAAELAADRTRLMAELQAVRADLEKHQAGRSGMFNRRPSFGADPRVTIAGGGIPAVPETRDAGAVAGTTADPRRPLPVARQLADEFASLIPSPNGRSDNLQALLAAPIDTGALLSGTADLSQYEALLAALDEEAQQLDEELAGKEASSSVLLQRMRATKQAITARMETLQAALQSARDAESEMRRQAADKDATIQRLQQQLAQLSGGDITHTAEAAAPAGQGGAASPLGIGPGVLQGNTVILALRQDLDAAHERLRDAGRQLREAQQRADSAEAEVRKQCSTFADALTEVARLRTELSANDRVLAEAESALVALVGEKEALEQKLESAQAAERRAAETAEGLREQVSALRSQLEASSASELAVGAKAVHDHSNYHLQSQDEDAASSRLLVGNRGQLNRTTHEESPPAASQDSVSGTRLAAVPTSVPAFKLRNSMDRRTSESGSAPCTLQSGNMGGMWEALSTSGCNNSGAIRPCPTPLAADSRMPLVAQTDTGTGRGSGSAEAQGARPVLTSRDSALGVHISRGSDESATDASGLASPTGLYSTAQGSGSTSSSATQQDVAAGRHASIDTLHGTDNGCTAGTYSPHSSLARLISPGDSSSPRARLVHLHSANSAAGLVLRARASLAQAAANANSTAVESAAPRSGPSSPLSPSGLRIQARAERSPGSSANVAVEVGKRETDATTATTSAAATTCLVGMASLQRRHTRPSVTPQPRRFSSNYSRGLPACPGQQSASPLQVQNMAISVYMARPAAAAVANAALQTASYRLTTGSSLASPRAGPLERIVCATDSGDFQAHSTAVSPGSARAGGSPMISPRETIEQRSLSRAVEQVTQALTTPRHPGVQGQGAEVVAETVYFAADSACGDVHQSGSTSINASSVQVLLRGSSPSVRTSASTETDTAPIVGASWPRADGDASSNPLGAGTTTSVAMATRPVYGTSLDRAATARVQSGSSAVVFPANMSQAIRREHYPGLATIHTAANQPSHIRGESIWTTVGEVLATGTSNFSQRSAPVVLRPDTSFNAQASRQKADSREVTPASLRRAAGLDESASMLATRLAAMDEALRAIGAA